MSITPIYLPDGSKLYVADNGRNSEGRVRYIIQVFTDAEGILLDCDTIRSGVNSQVNHMEALSAFSSFIGAWVEAQDYPGSENHDIFPAHLLEWAENNADELYMMTSEEEDFS